MPKEQQNKKEEKTYFLKFWGTLETPKLPLKWLAKAKIDQTALRGVQLASLGPKSQIWDWPFKIEPFNVEILTGSGYVLVSTGVHNGNAYPILSSADLVHWREVP